MARRATLSRATTLQIECLVASDYTAYFLPGVFLTSMLAARGGGFVSEAGPFQTLSEIRSRATRLVQKSRCRANMAQIGQSGPVSGLVVQVNFVCNPLSSEYGTS
jgi:hypothetical protein